MSKPVEREIARALRAESGLPMRELARMLDVSVSSISLWMRDVQVAPEHVERNMTRAQLGRAERWSELNRDKRRAYQAAGRARARQADPLHQAGCMLYWAEGAKARNTITFCNSDPQMVRFFCRFLRVSLDVDSERLRIRLNVYTGNGLEVAEIESYWLSLLDLDATALRKHAINHFPTSSSGGRVNRLPHGVCAVSVARSTPEIQHIYGAIQEYAGFDEPRWLTGPS
jgi:transcriptional regulator with XRE-family HTH domain